jgi:hypothetical protein
VAHLPNNALWRKLVSGSSFEHNYDKPNYREAATFADNEKSPYSQPTLLCCLELQTEVLQERRTNGLPVGCTSIRAYEHRLSYGMIYRSA